MIVFDNDNKPVLVIGSPGGKSIIPYVARVLYEVLAQGRDLQASINDAHLVHTGRKLVLESGFNPETMAALEQLGHDVSQRDQSSGLHAIQLVNGQWQGVADRRREGVVLAR